jgi:ABC-type branched-subunit amino acid transport system permease subunit
MVAAYLLTDREFPYVTVACYRHDRRAAVGYLVGLIALRRTGIYFAMITVAIAEVFFFVEFNPLSDFTGGENGLPACRRRRSISASPRCASTPTGRSIGIWRSGTSSAW